MLISAGFDDYWGEVCTMNPDGSHLTRLTDAPGAVDDGARWSPDGRRIAFHSNRNGSGDLYIMNADGTGQAPLLATPEAEWATDWAPNGRILVTQRTDAATSEWKIFVMNADGSGLVQLTNTASQWEWNLVWRPRRDGA